MGKGTRGELLDRLAGAIGSVTASHPLRVAVDGPPAAGKTTLADELALLLRSRGREVIRASAEGFHLPRAQRYRRGEFSPEANYHDSFDYGTLRRVLLDRSSTLSGSEYRLGGCPRAVFGRLGACRGPVGRSGLTARWLPGVP
jgi:hypothetical protein